MKEIKMSAIAMAPINVKDKKQWVFHGRIDGEPCRIVIDLGDDQFRLIERETDAVEPCS